MTDYPFDEVCATAKEWAAKGALVFQKFTCANCGARQTIDTPNRFHKTASCEECGHTTDIRAQGCNYLLIYSTRPAGGEHGAP